MMLSPMGCRFKPCIEFRARISHPSLPAASLGWMTKALEDRMRPYVIAWMRIRSELNCKVRPYYDAVQSLVGRTWLVPDGLARCPPWWITAPASPVLSDWGRK